MLHKSHKIYESLYHSSLHEVKEKIIQPQNCHQKHVAAMKCSITQTRRGQPDASLALTLRSMWLHLWGVLQF